MDPNNPNYPPGLSPQLDPTISPQAAPGAPSAPGLMSSAGPGYVMGQHEARLRTSDIAAGYAAASVTGAAEVGLRATQLFGMQSMIFGQAEQAMMAASNALPIDAVPEGATFDKARRYGRLRKASFVFDPFSQAAAVGKSMPGWQAAGQSAARAAEQAGALRAANIPAIGRGTRLAGTAMRLGMRLPGLLAGGVTFGASLAAQEAVIGSAGAIYEGHANRMKSATLVNQTAGASGVAFSQSEARGSDLTGMASRMGMDFEEFSGLTQTLSAGGNFQGVSDLQEFKSKLRGSLQQLKEIAQVTNSTLQEAAQVSSALKQQGFSGSQLPAAASQAFGLGSATGLGAGQFLQAGAMGAQYGAATNMGMSRGSSMFQQALGGVEFAMQQGKFSPEMIQRLGGSSSSATMALMQGTMGQAGQMGSTVSQMMGFIAKKGEGEYSTPVIDQAKLEKLLNGGVSRQQLAAVSQSQQVLGMSTAVQRAAMPQVNQMLHATLSDGTSSQEEYLRKAEMMGIPPDTAKLIMETERNRGFTEASGRLATGTAMAQQASSRTGRGFFRSIGLAGTGATTNSLSRVGDTVSRGMFSISQAIAGDDFTETPVSTEGRQRLIDSLSDGEGLEDARRLRATDRVRYGSGSGNMFFKGQGEARREANYREFDTLFRNQGRRGTERSVEGEVFGETTFQRRAVSMDAIQRASEHRRSFKPTEDMIRRASHAARSGDLDEDVLFENSGANMGTLFNRGARDDTMTVQAARQIGLRDDDYLQDLNIKAQRGTLSRQEAEEVQRLKSEVHATTANIKDMTDSMGADITAASGFGHLRGDALSAKVDDLARAVSGSQERTFIDKAGTLFGLLGSEDADLAALDTMLTGEGRSANAAKIRRAITEKQRLDGLGTGSKEATERALDTAFGDGIEGAELRVLTNLLGSARLKEGFDEFEKGLDFESYYRLVDPIAAGVRETTRGSSATGLFGRNLRRFGEAFGEEGATYDDRTAAMGDLMRRSLGDGTLISEAKTLREEGLRDVAALFSTVEALAGGGTVKDFTEDEVKAIGGDRKKAIDALKKKGMLSGVAGAQAQASADSSLQGRSLAGDLLAFSNMTKDLTVIVQNIADKTGVSLEKDPTGRFGESDVNEDGETEEK